MSITRVSRNTAPTSARIASNRARRAADRQDENLQEIEDIIELALIMADRAVQLLNRTQELDVDVVDLTGDEENIAPPSTPVDLHPRHDGTPGTDDSVAHGSEMREEDDEFDDGVTNLALAFELARDRPLTQEPEVIDLTTDDDENML